MSGCILHLSSLHSPVFLVNSCLDLFSAPRSHEDPFSRSYGVSLPSSLTMNLPTPQYVLHNHVCPFAVRVPNGLCLADFLGSLITDTIRLARRPLRTIRLQLRGWICLPSSTPLPFNQLFRQLAVVSLLRLHITRNISNGILTVSAIGLAFRLILRTRLTQGRLTLPWKPWSCGEGASHPLYRYLYLHLLFQPLQRESSHAFKAAGMLPYRSIT